ncbi:MAG TPA: hypothetical protein VKV20_10860 [Ktedonobacteraceae bacterium]|nr:hypothetical protein [Ktedonobacteraceae bacterium]
MPDNLPQHQNEKDTYDNEPISWWSWRPGIKPRNAMLFGGLLASLGLLLVGSGLFTLVVGIIDANSPPVQTPGTVTGHTTTIVDTMPHLIIRLHVYGEPEVAPAVSQSLAKIIRNGDPVLLDYSPRLHFLYALDYAGQRYPLPGTSASGDPFGSLALLLMGLLLFPYPLLLTRWGWLDWRAGHSGRVGRHCTIIASVVALRSTGQAQRTNRPGLTPRFAGSWYGVALQPLNSDEIKTFSVPEQTYKRLRKDTMVEIIFSPQLHYVYSIEERNIKNPLEN